MTRHGKNCTAGSVYTYAERKRDAKVSGYGTLHARLGADSIKEFHCCSLTLQPCRNPVITPNGYLYDKEAILENIIAQKKTIAKKLKQYEKQCAAESDDATKQEAANTEKKKLQFSAVESTPSRTGMATSQQSNPLKRVGGYMSSEIDAKVKATGNEGEMSNMKGDKSTSLPSFWLPELNPTAEASKLEKPSTKVVCPVSGKSLKLKDLMEVVFTPAPGTEKSAKKINVLIRILYFPHLARVYRAIVQPKNETCLGRTLERELLLTFPMFCPKKFHFWAGLWPDEHVPSEGSTKRYICPVTRDELTNTTRCAYLKPSKVVVTYDVVESLKKDDWIDPICGQKLTESDIIELQRGGTGYAATNEVKAKLIRPQLELQ